MFEFKLPDLGEGVHEGQIVSVLVKEGDPIQEFAPMLEVETDKAAVEIPSPRTGVISKLLCKPGQVVKVGETLVVIDDASSGAARSAAPAKSAEKPAAEVASAPAARTAAASEVRSAPAQTGVAARVADGRHTGAGTAVAASAQTVSRDGPASAAPVVRKLARELGLDINVIPGSGPNGRILREDVERFSKGGAPAARASGAAAEPAAFGGDASFAGLPAEQLPDFSQYGPIRREPVSQIRKTIARQMTRAWLNVTRVTHGDVADVTELERNRRALNESLKGDQPKMTITAIVLKAVAAALRDFPTLNCSYDAAAGEIIYKDYIHLGCAVDTPRGLVVPVIRDVDKKGLPTLSKELNELSERVRSGKFDVNRDLRGATFTVTNVGALGGTFATPMVNFPEVGILGLGKGAQQPVVRDGQIVARLMMPLFLSFDHRMVDGADAARFCRQVIGALENPLRLISM
ncbi:MAG: dihydrolipoamide acetyltransferase family protein [Phycisphaerae bacterium]